ncbi:hypothetical protein [Streptomyces synnematoformans]|uniref:Uncharacterized protein n=1 Tax=Streptomyces synnematoformans TaxID=415721 RepID=A0ABN2XG84_9ACTN
MSKAKDGLQIVAAPVGGWCDPHTGVCHIDTADEAASAEADNEVPRATCSMYPTLRTDECHRHLSLPTR